jgi:hypothetical protein
MIPDWEGPIIFIVREEISIGPYETTELKNQT